MTALPGQVTRRAERAADAAFLFALFRGSRHPSESLLGLDATLAAQLMRHQFAGQAASYRAAFPDARHAIIELDGMPIGRLVVDEGRDAWTLVDIALAAAWRGRGIGTGLLRETIAGARGAGVPLRLRVTVWNTDAARLYARLGFVARAMGEIDTEMVIQPGADTPGCDR